MFLGVVLTIGLAHAREGTDSVACSWVKVGWKGVLGGEKQDWAFWPLPGTSGSEDKEK